jgi:hypothetical protein
VRGEPVFIELHRRGFAEASRAKAEYLRETKRRLGLDASLRIADELRAYVLSVRPDWPSDAERRADREMHLRVIEAVRRAPSGRR